MSDNVKIIRNEATVDTLKEIYKVIRRIAKRLPEEEAMKLFYTEEELKKLRKQKKELVDPSSSK